MSNNDGGEVFLGLAGIVIGLVILYYFVVYVVLPAVLLLGAGGTLFGGGVSIRNYVQSFRTHVRVEKPSP